MEKGKVRIDIIIFVLILAFFNEYYENGNKCYESYYIDDIEYSFKEWVEKKNDKIM